MNRFRLLILSSLSVLTLGSLFSLNQKAPVTVKGYANGDATTYYNGISDSDTGSTLLAALQSLNDSKTQSLVGYNNMMKNFSQTDPGDRSGTIRSFYSGKSVSSGSCNREHVWPNSHGGNAVEDDIHMVRPTLKTENEGRGNSFYVEGMDDPYNGWDPANCGVESYRGDSARIIFYCVVAYSDFELLDVNKHYTTSENNDYKMGKLSDLLLWNLKYPVLQREKTRNEAAEKLQGNRNPFIDHPEYACKIWGNYNAATAKACAGYGENGHLDIKNDDVAVEEASIEVNNITQFTSSYKNAINPTYSWSICNSSGVDTASSVLSITSYSNNAVSVTSSSIGTGYLKASVSCTNSSGKQENLWTVLKVNVVKASTLTDIQIVSMPYKISYKVGETFDPSGLSVKATYSDGRTEDVTSLVTFSNINFNSAGKRTIYVSYTYNGVTLSASFSVFVDPKETTSSGGCGGNMVTSSILLSSLSLISILLINISIRKRKKK